MQMGGRNPTFYHEGRLRGLKQDVVPRRSDGHPTGVLLPATPHAPGLAYSLSAASRDHPRPPGRGGDNFLFWFATTRDCPLCFYQSRPAVQPRAAEAAAGAR